MEPQKKTTLTEGSVAKGMLLFALPIFISNLFQQLYNAADSLIVGNFLGGEALAAALSTACRWARALWWPATLVPRIGSACAAPSTLR